MVLVVSNFKLTKSHLPISVGQPYSLFRGVAAFLLHVMIIVANTVMK